MSNRLSKETISGVVRPWSAPWVVIMVLCCVAALLCLGGCDVSVGGKKRPLVRAEPLRGELEFKVENQRDSQGVSGNKRQSVTQVFEERLGLKTSGDVYHPDFIFFNAALGLGLAQQDIDSDDETGTEDATLNDYHITALLLRKKPYPITVYTAKHEDLIARQFLGSLKADRESSGASVTLNSKRWPMTFSYDTSETSQKGLGQTARDFFSRNDERLKYAISHEFSDRSKASLKIDRTDISQQRTVTTMNTQTDRLTFLHDFIFGAARQNRFNSSVNYMGQKGDFDYSTLSIDERMKLQHTSNFFTDYQIRTSNAQRQNLETNETRGRIGFEHRLYESLVTTGNMFGSLTDLDSQGDLEQYGGGAGLSYRKNNPWGTLLTSYNASYIDSRQSGGDGVGVVIGEPHIATDIVAVELDRTSIDIATIIVRDANNVPYQSEDYTIEGPFNGRIRLRIRTFGGMDPSLAEGDEFYVDYNYFIEPRRTEKTLRQDMTIKQQFKNGFSAFYTHQRQREDVSSSLTEITADEYTTNIVGIDFIRGGFYVGAEYSREDSTQIPSSGRRVETRYSFSVTPKTTATLRGTAHWLDFGQPDERDVTLYKAGAELFSRLTDQYDLSSRIDYRNEQDSRFGRTQGFQFNSELRYHYRQLSLATGAELSFLNRRKDEVNSAFFYLRLKREF